MFYGIVTNMKKYLQNVKLKLLSHKFPNQWWQKTGKFLNGPKMLLRFKGCIPWCYLEFVV